MSAINYRNCKRLIEAGRTEGMAGKLDILLKRHLLTQEEYEELKAMLTPKQPETV